MQEALFSQALGLAPPWAVERVQLDTSHSRIDLYIAWQSKGAACPACGALGLKCARPPPTQLAASGLLAVRGPRALPVTPHQLYCLPQHHPAAGALGP